MRKPTFLTAFPLLLAFVLAGAHTLRAQEGEPSGSHSARMTVTLRVLGNNKRTPEVSRDDIVVKQRKKTLPVTSWTPAIGESAGMDLFLLLDDSSDTSVSLQFDDLRAFIQSQPSSTLVGVGYMRNGIVDIAQDFTADHDLASKALRLPLSTGVFRSPYLSAIDLMKRWPASANRREIVMVTDGIDRFRNWPGRHEFGYVSPDVDSASRIAQRTGTIIDTIYMNGVGRWSRNFWEVTNGQNNMARLSDTTGGESYFLGTHSPVSFRPYLEDINKAIANQYLLEFRVVPEKKSGIQYVNMSTPIAGVELDSADGVWVDSKR